MSRKFAYVLVALSLAFAGEKNSGKNLTGSTDASNEAVDLSATVLLDKADIQQALGADPGEGMVVVRIKVTPHGAKPQMISPDDFTLLSRKDGERSPALAPAQIAGRATVTVKAEEHPMNSWGTPVANGPLWTGIGKSASSKAAPKADDPKTASDAPASDAPAAGSSKDRDAELLKILKAKSLPDAETNKPVEGLLYFRMDGKNRVKDLSLLYKTGSDKLVADFKQP